MSEILVTGAGGFIGSWLTQALLNSGHNVTALCRYTSSSNIGWLRHIPSSPNLQICFGDLSDQSFVESIVPSGGVVFNLAALIGIPYSYTASSSYLQTNILGTHALLNASLKKNVSKFLQTSTSEIYGTAQYTPIDENHPHVAQSPYAASKIASDQLALSFYRSFDLPVSVVRPFNTYGPRQSPRAFIPSVINQIIDPKSSSIKVGSLHPSRDFNFVTDTASGFISIMENFSNCIGKQLNISSGFTISMKEVVASLIDISGTTKSLVVDQARVRPSASEVDILFGTSTLLNSLTGWTPTYGGLQGFKQGLELTYRWFVDNVNHASDSSTYSV